VVSGAVVVIENGKKAYGIDVVFDYVWFYDFGDGMCIPYVRDIVFECSGYIISVSLYKDVSGKKKHTGYLLPSAESCQCLERPGYDRARQHVSPRDRQRRL
jgi:hypothetical protein